MQIFTRSSYFIQKQMMTNNLFQIDGENNRATQKNTQDTIRRFLIMQIVFWFLKYFQLELYFFHFFWPQSQLGCYFSNPNENGYCVCVPLATMSCKKFSLDHSWKDKSFYGMATSRNINVKHRIIEVEALQNAITEKIKNFAKLNV